MRYITVAIHTYEKAIALRSLLESEGISVELNNVNLEVPGFSSGVRVRIPEHDLPLALRIIENKELFAQPAGEQPVEHTYLVPVDFSEKSFKAAEVAAHLAAQKGARLKFLYSYIDPYVDGNVQLTDTLSYEIGERGAREAELPSMIIMGTRGMEKKEAEMIGSVTAEVLDEGRYMVLTVPEPLGVEQSLNPANILFFSNLDQDDILAMDALYRLFGDCKAKVTIIHTPKRSRFSDSSAGKALQRLGKFFAVLFCDCACIPVGRRQGICRLAAESQFRPCCRS